MNTLYFDEFVYYPQGASKVRIEYDIDPDIDRRPPFEEHIDPIVLEQAWNDRYPEDKGGFWTCYNDDRNAWSAWIIEWAKANLFNQYSPQLDYKERYEMLARENQKLVNQIKIKDELLGINANMIETLADNVIKLDLGDSLKEKEQYREVKGEVKESVINDRQYLYDSARTCKAVVFPTRKTA